MNYAGLKLKNPFLIGSGPISTDLNTISQERAKSVSKRVEEAGWAGIALKTVTHYKAVERAGPFMWSPHNKTLQDTLQNLGPWETKISKSNLKKNVAIAKKETNLAIIGNVLGTTDNEWVELCQEVEECGVDAIELNVSCPHSGHELPLIGQDPAYIEETVARAKKATSLPIIPKLPAIIIDIVAVAKAAEKGGADAIAAINTVPGMVGINIDTGIPIHHDIANNARYSGVSGPLVKPIGLAYVVQMASAIKIPISGIGGIKDWKDAVEYIMAGATTVQVCTEMMMKGFDLAKQLQQGLTDFMNSKGYKSVDSIRGLSLKYFKTTMEEMDTTSKVVSVIDPKLCTGCGLCVTACRDSIVEALQMKNKKAVVNKGICIGCGLCGVVCPFSAVSFKKE